MTAIPILSRQPLGMHWPTLDPFLFCAHHDDHYPAGDGRLGLARSALGGRALGSDFSRQDGFSMYHGQHVPGFPVHPHRGFETVTLVRQGLIDHSDSLGAAARFGGGDVQWITTGAGLQHAEMFPMLRTDAPNRIELFQVWLNLPARNKMAAPHFTMLWNERIPRLEQVDAAGARTLVRAVAGALPGTDAPLAPPPQSWASQADADLAIWTLQLAPGARWTLPRAAGAHTRRMLYFFAGNALHIGPEQLTAHAAVELDAHTDWPLHNSGTEPLECLLLQGRPIGEPVAQYGPFVMNAPHEVQQAIADYRASGFGGWPWADAAPVHGPLARRFARHPGADADELPPPPPPSPSGTMQAVFSPESKA